MVAGDWHKTFALLVGIEVPINTSCPHFGFSPLHLSRPHFTRHVMCQELSSSLCRDGLKLGLNGVFGSGRALSAFAALPDLV